MFAAEACADREQQRRSSSRISICCLWWNETRCDARWVTRLSNMRSTIAVRRGSISGSSPCSKPLTRCSTYWSMQRAARHSRAVSRQAFASDGLSRCQAWGTASAPRIVCTYSDCSSTSNSLPAPRALLSASFSSPRL